MRVHNHLLAEATSSQAGDVEVGPDLVTATKTIEASTSDQFDGGRAAPQPSAARTASRTTHGVTGGLVSLYASMRLDLERALCALTEAKLDEALYSYMPVDELTSIEVVCRPGTIETQVSDLVSYMSSRGRLENLLRAVRVDNPNFNFTALPGFIRYLESARVPTGEQVAYRGDRPLEPIDGANEHNGAALQALYDAVMGFDLARRRALLQLPVGGVAGTLEHDRLMSMLPQLALGRSPRAMSGLFRAMGLQYVDLATYFGATIVRSQAPVLGRLKCSAVDKFANALTRRTRESVIVFDFGWRPEDLMDSQLSGRDQTEQLLASLIERRCLDRFVEAAAERYPGLAVELRSARDELVIREP